MQENTYRDEFWMAVAYWLPLWETSDALTMALWCDMKRQGRTPAQRERYMQALRSDDLICY